HCRNARSIAAFDFPRSERSIDCSHIVTRSLAITTQPTVVPMTTLAIPNPDTSCNHDASACPSLARFTLVNFPPLFSPDHYPSDLPLQCSAAAAAKYFDRCFAHPTERPLPGS